MAEDTNDTGLSDLDILEKEHPDTEESDSTDVVEPETEESEDEPSEEDEEESDEDKDKEEEEEEEEESEEEQADSEGVLSVKDITAKYPKVFKDFPELKKNFFLARQYEQIIPTVDDARAAVEQANYYQYFQAKVLQGDAKEVLDSISNSGEKKALQKFTENFLPSLKEVDESSFYRVTTPVIQQVLYAAVQQGVSSNDKNLAEAAKWIHNFVFGNPNVGKPQWANREPQDEQIDPERQQFIRDKMQFERSRMEESMSEVSGNIVSEMKKIIIKDLDPRNEMQPYMRKKLLEDIIQETGRILSRDQHHLRKMDSLWENLRATGMRQNGKTRIKDTYLARAIQALPSVRARLKAEALGRKVKNNDRTVHRPLGKQEREGKQERSAQRFNKNVPDAKKVDFDKTSDMDIILGKATLKKG
jgi:hypothetical protein